MGSQNKYKAALEDKNHEPMVLFTVNKTTKDVYTISSLPTRDDVIEFLEIILNNLKSGGSQVDDLE